MTAITLRDDLDAITLILNETFRVEPFKRDYDQAFEHVDLVAMPTTPTPAFRLGEKTDDPIQMYLADVFTVSANLAGVPAISVPCGFSREGLPIGFQLTGRMFDEATLLRAADAYQRDTSWHTRAPALEP